MIRFLIPSLALSLVTGFCTGVAIAAHTVYPDVTVQLVDDHSSSFIPIVRLEGIRNGVLRGSMTGAVRVVAGSRIVQAESDGSFSIGDRALLTNIIHIPVPEGMQFVASKRGKKYYPVGSASAANLAPANRIYFPTSEAAEKAGYRK